MVKVLIHELIHSFGLEFSSMNLINFNNELYKIFPINSKFNIFESYTEVWAEIINISLIAFLNSSNKSEYLKNVKNLLEIEIYYSKFQTIKILNYYNIDFEGLMDKDMGKQYKENTNIFAYYVMKYMLLLNINKLMEWCNKNNRNFIKFKDSNKNLRSFLNLIREILRTLKKSDIRLGKKLDILSNKNKNYILNNLRMSSLEL